jgi:hypothetical protein
VTNTGNRIVLDDIQQIVQVLKPIKIKKSIKNIKRLAKKFVV